MASGSRQLNKGRKVVKCDLYRNPKRRPLIRLRSTTVTAFVIYPQLSILHDL